MKYLLRCGSGEKAKASEQELVDSLVRGECHAGDFVFEFATGRWSRVGEHEIFAGFFALKPTSTPEKKLVYFFPHNRASAPEGPFSVKEIQQKIGERKLSESTWIFVEGDKEWRQIKSVKALFDSLPRLPGDVPAAPVAPPTAVAAPGVLEVPQETNPSILLEPMTDAPSAPSGGGGDPYVETEDPTMAFSTLGLALDKEKASIPAAVMAPPPAPPRITMSEPETPPPAVKAPEKKVSIEEGRDQGSADGVPVEIPTDPIWLVKKANSEAVMGPFRFLEVAQFLKEGQIDKNDKISKAGSNRFGKIGQQFEFNVKFSVETVVENGVEKQKIYIRRRFHRAPYITGVQVTAKSGLFVGNCVNISAGGILMELSKAELNLGDVIDVKILPGLIPRTITSKALIIGKIPKLPTGYALKFENLKKEDKEAIEFFVQETVKREMH